MRNGTRNCEKDGSTPMTSHNTTVKMADGRTRIASNTEPSWVSLLSAKNKKIYGHKFSSVKLDD